MKFIGVSRKGGGVPHGDDNPDTVDAVPNMTSNTTPSGVCSASSIYSATYPAWRAFSGTTAPWYSETVPPAWLQYEFATAISINKYFLDSIGDTVSCITHWTLLASNTGAFTGEEVTLDTRVNQPREVANWFTFANGTLYKFYRFHITATYAGGEPTYVREIALIRTQGT